MKTKKSLNLKKLGVVLAVPTLILGGFGYYMLSDSEEDVGFQPLGGKRGQLTAPETGIKRTSLPGSSGSLPNSDEPQLSLTAESSSTDAQASSTEERPSQSRQQLSETSQVAQNQQTTQIPSTVDLLTTEGLDVLVEDPFATSAVAAAGEQLAAQQQILVKRTEFAENYAKFLTAKHQVMEAQKKLAEGAAAVEDEESLEKSTSERFLDDKVTSTSSSSSEDNKVLDRFKVPEVAQSGGGSDVYEDIDEPEPIDVLGIISSSNTGSILILKDGRRLPLKTGTRLDENWKIQKVNINEDRADITFETNDRSKTSTQTVVF